MIIIAPFAKGCPSTEGKNPKDYPYWEQVVDTLRYSGIKTIQIGTESEIDIGCDQRYNSLSFKELESLLQNVGKWASVDSFFQHFAYYRGYPGVTIFSQSDPKIFGHEGNINLLKSRSYLRKAQFDWWYAHDYNKDAFPSYEFVSNEILKYIRG